MAAVIVTTCANNLMGVRASRSIGLHFSGRHHDFPYTYKSNAGIQRSSMSYGRTVSNIGAFVPSSATFIHRSREQQPVTIQLQPAIPTFGRCCNIHSTTALFAKKKKNGGKSKKAILKPAQKSRREVEDDNTQTLTADSPAQELSEIFDGADVEASPEFTAHFASDYHAPVMPKECIEALLQQGEWGEMLADRKERWRKKRSIIEAKKRRAGYYDADVEKDDNDQDDDLLSMAISADTTEQPKPRLFVDGTLGGGGHSQAMLEQLSAGDILIGCDVDPEALATASTRLADYLGTSEYIVDKIDDEEQQPKCGWEQGRPMFIPVQSNFRNLVAVLSKVRHPVSGKLLLGNRDNSGTDDTNEHQIEFPRGVNGMLLDLGVSSHQIDTSERGFAFMKEGPLDMRMSGNSQLGSLTAADICNEFDEGTLIDILRNYGDEPRAKRIASAIVASRPLHTTTDLVHAINSVTPTFARQKRAGLIATSARVFQALRIVVNEEDGALKDVLEGVAPWALARSQSHYLSQVESVGDDAVDGILAVLSYHSMEDKMAKRVIREGKVDLLERGTRKRAGALERDLYGNIIGDDTDSSNPFETLSKPRKATDEEVAANSRSRSATLRVAVRI